MKSENLFTMKFLTTTHIFFHPILLPLLPTVALSSRFYETNHRMGQLFLTVNPIVK